MRSAHRVSALVIVVTTSLFGVVSGSASAGELARKDRALQLCRATDAPSRRPECERASAPRPESYAVYPEPLVLYNLARALEGLGDFAGAVSEYERYLRTGGNLSDRGGIERRVGTLRAYMTAAGSGTVASMPT